MSQFPFNITNSPFIRDPLVDSTKTKQAEPYFPTLNFSPEEQFEENQRFYKFISDTVEGNEFTQRSLLDHQLQKSMGKYHELKSDFYNQVAKTNPNKNTDRALSSWRLDKTETPVISVSVAPQGYGLFLPKDLSKESWQNVDEFTFSGGSTWGALLNREATAPQSAELLGRNAQTNHFMAVRARGGRKGELWQTTMVNSSWLAGMLKEDETVKQELNSWIDSSPYAWNIKGSIPLSAYFGDTMLDVLANAPKPQDWDTKKAIEELKIADPGLSDILFNELGVEESRLIELGQTPLQFKYFIADALDQHAFSRFLGEYSKSAGGFESFYATTAFPLIRDSFNSNDNFSELLATAGGFLLTSTGVGAAIGIPVFISGVTSMVLKPLRIVKKGMETVDKYETMAKLTARVGQANKYIWQAKKILPSNITDTVFDATGITKKFFTAPEKATRTRQVLTYGLKQFIGEGTQGVIESVINQSEAIENGFQQRFSLTEVGYNALEEGIGGLALGGPIRLVGNRAEAFTTTKAGQFVTKKLGEVKAAAISTVDIKISDANKRNLRLAANTILGIPEGVDFNTYQNAIETELRLSAIVDRINKTTGFGDILTPKDTEDPLLTNVLDILSEGNAGNNFKSRVEILRRIDSAIDKTTDSKTGKSTLSGEDVETLVFLTGMDASKGQKGTQTKLIENFWLSRELSQGRKTNHDGKPLSVIDMTSDDILYHAEDISQSTQLLVTKLGVKSSEEIETVLLNGIGPNQIQLINEVVTETKENLESGKSVSIAIENLPLEGTVPTSISSTAISITTEEKSELDLMDEIVDRTQQPIIERNKQNLPYALAQERKRQESMERQYQLEKREEEVKEAAKRGETLPVKPLDISQNFFESLLEDIEKPISTEEEINLTADEIADLTDRVCYRKDNP